MTDSLTTPFLAVLTFMLSTIGTDVILFFTVCFLETVIIPADLRLFHRVLEPSRTESYEMRCCFAIVTIVRLTT